MHLLLAKSGKRAIIEQVIMRKGGIIMRKSADHDMTSGVIWKHIVEFAVPMFIGLLFQQLYNTVDTIVVGKFVNEQALAAVGCNGPIINTVVGAFAGLATGASVVIAQLYGAHDGKNLHRAVQTTIVSTLILCVVGTVVGLALVNPMLRLNQTPGDVLPDATDYLVIYFAGLSGLTIYNVGSGILRAVGDSRRPLYFLIVSAVTNTALDLLFVICFDMKVKGVAYATIIAELVSAILVLITLTRVKADYAICWNKLCLDKKLLRDMLKIGLPSAIQSAVTCFSNVFVQSYINEYGTSCMAGWTIYNKMDAFVTLPLQSIGLGSTTFVGQNWGADKRTRAARGVSVSIRLGIGCTVVLMTLALIFARPILTLFSDSEAALEYGTYFVQIITPFYLFCCFHNIYAGALRGIGNSKLPTYIMLISFVAVRQIYLFVTKQLCPSRLAVALAYPVGWVLCTILLIIFYGRSELGKASREKLVSD